MLEKTNKNKAVKNTYRLVVLNDSTFEEKFSLVLTRTNSWIFAGTVAIVLMVITASAIIYTPLKYLIPGFGNYNDRRLIVNLAMQTDSIEEVLNARAIKIGNIEGVFTDKIEIPKQNADKSEIKSADKTVQPEVASEQEMNLRKEIDDIENFAISDSKTLNNVNLQLRNYHFMAPVSGVVTDEFNSSIGHNGVDIATKQGEPVMAVLDGTVIYTGYDAETGYTVAIQHKDNLVSVYKHNAAILKSIGNAI
ncbi:MAG TPA: M23 family metallopeptidase, partial [Chitinophagales bacterium]